MNTPSDYLSDHQVFSNKKGMLIFLLALLGALFLWYVLPYKEMENRGLALLFFIAVLWMTEAVHTTITALLVPVLAVLLHFPDMSAKAAFSNFANPIIYLFFGGFALAAALQVNQLDRKIAINVVRLCGGHMGKAMVLLFLVTAALSMWISNTATTAMMLPLTLGLLSLVDREKDRSTFVFALLGIAYSASIGGLGAIVGSPPNAIAAKALNMTFTHWLEVGVPFVIVMMPTMMLTLWFVFRPRLNNKITLEVDDVPWNKKRVLTLVVFVCTALAWVFSAKLGAIFHLKGLDGVIAVLAVVVIALLDLAKWKQISEYTDWGVLLLFGGGITLSVVLTKSGAIQILGHAVASFLVGTPVLLTLFIFALFIVLLTEFSSNTATAALLVPIFAEIASTMNIPVATLVMTVGLGVSLAFMMPVATPPNAIVMGSGLIKQREMMYAGSVLNFVSAVILTLFIYYIF